MPIIVYSFFTYTLIFNLENSYWSSMYQKRMAFRGENLDRDEKQVVIQKFTNFEISHFQLFSGNENARTVIIFPVIS